MRIGQWKLYEVWRQLVRGGSGPAHHDQLPLLITKSFLLNSDNNVVDKDGQREIYKAQDAPERTLWAPILHISHPLLRKCVPISTQIGSHPIVYTDAFSLKLRCKPNSTAFLTDAPPLLLYTDACVIAQKFQDCICSKKNRLSTYKFIGIRMMHVSAATIRSMILAV